MHQKASLKSNPLNNISFKYFSPVFYTFFQFEVFHSYNYLSRFSY